MVSPAHFDIGYSDSYMVMPFSKTKNENGVEFSVKSNYHEEEINKQIFGYTKSKRQGRAHISYLHSQSLNYNCVSRVDCN